MKSTISILVITLVIFSCNRKEELYDQVMEIHDISMAKMDKIMSLKSDLKEKIQTLSMDSVNDHSAKINEMESILADLNEADEGMMSWMRDFHSNYENMQRDEIMEYLENQREKITQVGQTMNEAISQAEDYLEKN